MIRDVFCLCWQLLLRVGVGCGRLMFSSSLLLYLLYPPTSPSPQAPQDPLLEPPRLPTCYLLPQSLSTPCGPSSDHLQFPSSNPPPFPLSFFHPLSAPTTDRALHEQRFRRITNRRSSEMLPWTVGIHRHSAENPPSIMGHCSIPPLSMPCNRAAHSPTPWKGLQAWIYCKDTPQQAIKGDGNELRCSICESSGVQQLCTRATKHPPPASYLRPRHATQKLHGSRATEDFL